MIDAPLLPWPDAVLERATERRAAAGFMPDLLAGARYLAMLLSGGKTLVKDGRILFLDPAVLPAGDEAGRGTVFLGSTTDAVAPMGPDIDLVLVHGVDEADAAALAESEGAVLLGYREAVATLDAAHAAIFIEASAIANWHRGHTHCPRCGAETVPESGGWVRRCSNDGTEHFPRTDPAIIVAVVGADDRILLGGGTNWESNRYSTLAGFVEPGESLEQAVVREIAEEVGVRLHSPRYLGSQSWPFPASLMLGFIAYTDDDVATPDGVEVTRARWFSRAELAEAVSSGEVVISARLSIARSLIEHWYGGRIEDAPASNTAKEAVGG
ncbi:NAD(+) diphosphatase [Arthrobacter sp. 35W]|uniref:NAD(+) diphosphatase n=1 Tax=Arthrobacter sp. 35W TaxID=1132441 RepID=UPI0003FBAD73|nr:NAD(+) diphosphatase [Arthrobacter sp. 35W]